MSFDCMMLPNSKIGVFVINETEIDKTVTVKFTEIAIDLGVGWLLSFQRHTPSKEQFKP